MALAELLKGAGVRSGIRETAGDLYVPIEISKKKRTAINKAKLPLGLAMVMRITRRIDEQIVPIIIKGILFPNLVSVASEIIPKSGKRNRARTLSSAITTPVNVSPRLNVYFRIFGISLS
jgi:hypothetical protein